MKILSLRLKGFIGIKKGLGLDEITIDFSTLSGLIALAGPNGFGKSTVIDSLSPFRTLPSRGKSLQHHCFLRDSEKELVFTHDGHTYRTLVKIDAESDRSEGFVYKDGAETSEVNGKVTEYDRYIENLFGTPTLFFNSVFCAQNADKISDLTTAELKKLFAEFLRLDRLVEFENTAKQCIGVLTGRAEKIALEIASRAADVLKLEGLETEREALKSKASETLYEIGKINARIGNTGDEIDDLKIALASVTAQEQRVAGLEDAKKKATAEYQAEQDRDTKALDAIRARAREVDTEVKRINAVLADADRINDAAGEVARLDEEITKATANLEKMNREASAISKTVNQLVAESASIEKKFSAELALIRKTITDSHAEKSRLETEIDKAKTRLKSLDCDHDLTALQHERKHCADKMADLDKRDPECQSMQCSFIIGAIKARDRLPEIDVTITERQRVVDDEKAALLEIIETKQAAFDAANRREKDAEAAYEKAESGRQSERDRLSDALGKAHADQDSMDDEIDKVHKPHIARMKQSRDELAALASRKSEIEVAQSKLEDATRRRSEVFEEGGKLRATMEEREKRHADSVLEIDGQIVAIRASIDAGAKDKLKALEFALEALKKSQAEQLSLHSEIDGNVKAVEIKVAECRRAVAENAEAGARLDAVRKEISEWEYLKNACGKDGLRALEIDSVAPIITGYANDLLTATFGPNYTVKFRTQDEETGKEVLDIVVIREDGTEVLLENLSGGEKVWSLKALRLAMTLISKEKSGRNFLTVLADEEDGALDVDNARHFIDLYRSFMAEGGFEDCIFISHKPECVGMADHVIEFRKGGVTVQ